MRTRPDSERQSADKAGSAGRFPSLDGLRTVSIALVILGHLHGCRGFPSLELGIGDYAHLGVVFFFVISGFLITSLLLMEFHKTGTASLPRFCARRALRIFPALYAYVACVCIFRVAVGFHYQQWYDVWHSLTYTVNYAPKMSWIFVHLWSLSVEEQFYLLWPLALFLLRPKRAVKASVVILCLAPLARLAARIWFSHSAYYLLPGVLPLCADSLAAGCLLACARGWLERQPAYLRCFRPWFSLPVFAMVLILNRYRDYDTATWVIVTLLLNLALAFLVHRSIYCARDWAGGLLNWKPLAAVGALSYSLYVWQQPFLNHHSQAWWCAFPQNLIFACLAAGASYLLLEMPLLKWRSRLRAVPVGPGPLPAAGA